MLKKTLTIVEIQDGSHVIQGLLSAYRLGKPTFWGYLRRKKDADPISHLKKKYPKIYRNDIQYKYPENFDYDLFQKEVIEKVNNLNRKNFSDEKFRNILKYAGILIYQDDTAFLELFDRLAA